MDQSVSSSPPWDAISALYADLKFVEAVQPGGIAARDIEAAIGLLLDKRISSTHSRYLTRDAVRRARFLRRQADEQRRTAAARVRPGHSITTIAPPRPDDRDQSEQDADSDAELFVVDPDNVEDIVCADDLAARIAAAVDSATGRPHGPVLDGLRRDLSTATIAAQLCVSRSTVLRSITILRERARTLTATGWAVS